MVQGVYVRLIEAGDTSIPLKNTRMPLLLSQNGPCRPSVDRIGERAVFSKARFELCIIKHQHLRLLEPYGEASPAAHRREKSPRGSLVMDGY
jgi:hypothetical protein